MAGASDNPSRRAVLGAVAAVSLSGIGAGKEEAPPPPFGWSPSPANAGEDFYGALASFRSAEGAVREEERLTAGWAYAAARAREEVYGGLLDAMQAGLVRLLRTPAPDVGALAVKIELAIAHEVWELSQGAACGAAILGDALRQAQDRPFGCAQDERRERGRSRE